MSGLGMEHRATPVIVCPAINLFFRWRQEEEGQAGTAQSSRKRKTHFYSANKGYDHGRVLLDLSEAQAMRR